MHPIIGGAQRSYLVLFQVSEGGRESLAHTRSPSHPVGLHRAQDCSLGEGDAAILLDFFPDSPMGLESSLRQSGPEVKSMDTEPDGSWL